jgi:hypothetical protein
MSPSKAHRRCGEMARWLPFDSASFGLALTPITFGVVEFRERLNSKTQATRCDASACVRPRRPTCKPGNWPVARRSPGREHAAWLPCRCDAGVIQPTYSRDEIASENGFSAEQLRTSPPRSIIPAWLPPPRYFLKIARAAGRRFRLIRIRRMNRLSGGLFGVPSHICTTSIESETRGGRIERD